MHALVRDPVDRFISMLGEVIRRALLGECPEGKCDVKRDGFDHAALASMKAQPWYDSASYLINIPPNNTGARRHWLLRTVSAFLETSQCNLQYYGSEHSISQVQQLVSQGGGPGTPGSGNVVVHSLEEMEEENSARNSTFIQALGFTDNNAWTVKDCFERNPKFTLRRERETIHTNAPPYLPSHEEVRKIMTASKQLGLPMLATYGQDMLCLGYTTPTLWADELAVIGTKELQRLETEKELKRLEKPENETRHAATVSTEHNSSRSSASSSKSSGDASSASPSYLLEQRHAHHWSNLLELLVGVAPSSNAAASINSSLPQQHNASAPRTEDLPLQLRVDKRSAMMSMYDGITM